MHHSTWQVPSQRSVAIACVGESNFIDEILRAATATRRSLPPIEEFTRVRLQPEGEEIHVFAKHGAQIASLAPQDAADLRSLVHRTIAAEGEIWCDARISGNESLAAQWRMQIWIYLDDAGATV